MYHWHALNDLKGELGQGRQGPMAVILLGSCAGFKVPLTRCSCFVGLLAGAPLAITQSGAEGFINSVRQYSRQDVPWSCHVYGVPLSVRMRHPDPHVVTIWFVGVELDTLAGDVYRYAEQFLRAVDSGREIVL